MKTKRWLLTFLVAVGILSVALPATSNAQTPDIQGGLCAGANFDIQEGAANTADCANDGGTEKLNSLITKFINILSAIVGIVAVIMIIVGGLRYITSGGSDSNVTGAKNTILYAVIGLIIVALAQIIVRFVLNSVSTV